MLTTNLATGRLLELLDRTIADLETIKRHLPAAMRRLDDAEPGYPGGQLTTSSTAISTDDGPIRSAIILNDNALKDAADLRKHLGRLTTDARNTLAICQRWGITRHGSAEGVDERSTVCDWCSSPREVKTRRLCNWCTSTLAAVNAERRDIGRQPVNRLPAPALEHRRNGRSARITNADVARWARNGGK